MIYFQTNFEQNTFRGIFKKENEKKNDWNDFKMIDLLQNALANSKKEIE